MVRITENIILSVYGYTIISLYTSLSISRFEIYLPNIHANDRQINNRWSISLCAKVKEIEYHVILTQSL